MKTYTKTEAIEAGNEFIKKVNELEEEYGLTLNSDTGDIYLSFQNSNKTPNQSKWDHVKLGWVGDGTGIKVIEKIKDKEFYKKQALSKLSKEEKDALGINE